MAEKKSLLFSLFVKILGLSVILGIIVFTIFLYYSVRESSEKCYLRIEGPGSADLVFDEDEKCSVIQIKPADVSQNGVDDVFNNSSNEDILPTQIILDTTIVPENNPVALAEKYRGIKNTPVMLEEPPIPYINGEIIKFWVLNVDENNYRSIDAELAYQTPHVYFWVEDGINYISSDVKDLVDVFENQIYQRNREIFGKEWSPGIDNDVHLTILYAQELGGAAGYFSSADSLMPEIDRFSNTAEMFYLSADYIDLNDLFTYGVLAHEFQHMIHWNIDRNETSWINEGLSELAVELNGFSTGGFPFLFAADPDLQLNFWPGNDQGDSTPHYGASYLFVKYLFERYGSDFISALVSQPKNGMQGLDAILSSSQKKVHVSPTTSEQIFQDWTIANILQNDEIEGGIYGYGKNSSIPSFFPTEIIECGSEPVSRTVNQFGTDFLAILCESDYEISVQWNPEIPIISENPKSGKYYYWSNAGDESGMRLSRGFDLAEISGPVELSYWAWYDIEEDYDYLYVNVSEDGKSWHVLETPSCTNEDPTGSNLGCGYNGKSSGWIREIVDLSGYAGKNIIVGFEYITDASVNGEGFLLDDVEIKAINFIDDFEVPDGEWVAEGFVRIENTLPQIFSVSVIEKDRGLNIEKFIFEKQTEISYSVYNSDKKIHEIIVVSGLSSYTHIPAQYEISILRID